jgi:predicted ATPase
MALLKALQLQGLLSFAPDSEPIALTPLNVLIGPNGSGKSNLIEAIELLHAAPAAFADAIRDGSGAREWLWKGTGTNGHASIEAFIHGTPTISDLRYQLKFTASGQRTEVTDEVIEEARRRAGERDVSFYYRFQAGRPVISVRGVPDDARTERSLERASLVPDESILSQRKDPDLYPELTWLGQTFGQVQIFREWSFGRYAAVRQPQPADLPSSRLASASRSLGLILNHLEHGDTAPELNRCVQTFLPRYQRLSTRVEGGTVQFFLHEKGLKTPVPATRLSDGTIRFLAMLTVLLAPAPAPLVCIEEPELGLHPDAVVMLAELLVRASHRMQLVVTTHSDALVSALTEEADSVLVCEHTGQTELHRVESAKLRHWLDNYRLGEIWRIGQLGGNP